MAVGSGVLVNDTDIDTLHSALTAVLDVDVAHGVLALNADGSFTYTPTAAYVGADSFTYHANDGALNSNIVTVSLTVSANTAPNAVNDPATVVSGSPYTPINVLANDTDANSDVLHVTAVSNPPHGSAAITGGGAGLSYRPDTNFIGTDSFTYTISDGNGGTDTATVTVTVPEDTFKPVATAPNQTFSAQTIGTSTVKVRLTWTGTDQGSGINRFELWQSTNGGAYTRILTTVGHSGLREPHPREHVPLPGAGDRQQGQRGRHGLRPELHRLPLPGDLGLDRLLEPVADPDQHRLQRRPRQVDDDQRNDATFTTLSRTIAFVTTKSPNRGPPTSTSTGSSGPTSS